MSVHKYNSWGRTRRPKAADGDGNYVTGSGIASDGAAAGLPALTGIGGNGGPSDGVYKTENQRYMHINCSGSNSGISNVYVYMYAAANWSELKTVNPTDGTRDSVVCGANEHIIVDLKGADMVAVVTGSSPKLPYANYVAFSTF